MTRLKKELMAKGIIFDVDEWYTNYGECQELYAIEGNFIITIWGCDVLDPEFRIYDRHTFEFIGGQDMYKSLSFCSNQPKEEFHSYAVESEVA